MQHLHSASFISIAFFIGICQMFAAKILKVGSALRFEFRILIGKDTWTKF